MSVRKSVDNMPEVSVIIPIYNVERYLETAVRSVIKQTFTNWEMLLLDDCAVDGSYTIAERLAAEDLRIRLIRNETNLGVAKTRDRGIEQSRGRYVAFLDSDDIWYPQKLEEQLRVLHENDADLVYTSYSIIDENGDKVRNDYITQTHVTYEQLLKENYIGCSTVLVKKELVSKYRFSMGFYHEDYTLWIRMLRDGVKAVGCPEILVDWRYIANSRSFNKGRAARNRWRIYRRFLKLPLLKSMWCFFNYMIGGMKKYFISRK